MALDPTSTARGLKIGCQGVDFSGSLGCVARLGGRPVMLGSAHVMTKAGNGVPGSESIVTRVAPRRLGVLLDTTAALDFGASALNFADAALATFEGKPSDAEIGGWGPITDKSSLIYEDMSVFACGCVSGPRRATIVESYWQGAIGYDGYGQANFTGLVRAVPSYGAPGDSGAAVLNNRMEIVGLHVASDGESYSLFCPIDRILKRWPELSFG